MGLLAVILGLVLSLQDNKVDDARIRSLIEQLGADFLDEREPARKALEKEGKAAERLLIESLSHADHRVRRSCLDLLIPLKSVGALQRAADLFALDEDPSVRDSAFRLLQGLGIAAEDAIIAALSSPAAEYRRGAIQTLSELRSEKAVKRIAELFDRETDKAVKDAAWKCLMSIGQPAEPYLVKYLQDPDAAIRRDAVTGLRGNPDGETLAAVARLFLQETDEVPLLAASEYLQRAGLKAEPAFLGGLQSPRPGTRLKSIQGLLGIRSPKGLEPVAQIFLGECPPDLLGAAADYLKAQGLRAEDPLIRGLDGKDPAVRFSAIQVLGELGSEKALPAVARLFRDEKNKKLHDQCFDFFRRLGLKAEKELLGALTDEDKDLRRQAVIALGDAQSELAIPRLVEFMTELDPSMKEASEAALASIGPKAIAAVHEAVAQGRAKKQVAEAIEAYYARGEVERLLEAQLGDDDSTGFFEGQFKDLEAFGRAKATPILIRILSERLYVFRRAHRRREPESFRNTMKELAVMALGEIGGEGALPALRAFLGDQVQMRLSGRIQEETLVALYRQGDKQPLENHLRETRQAVDDQLKIEAGDSRSDACDQLFSLGLLYNRIQRNEDAEKVYLELLGTVDKYKLEKAREHNVSSTYYNLACLNSVRGDRAKAVEWLQKSVRAGYVNRSWIQKDRDLDGIRGEEGYKKLLADDALFEKRKPDESPADR